MTLRLGKYDIPISAQKTTKANLRPFQFLRKLNNLTSDNYKNDNHLFSTLTNAAQNMAEKKLFCKLDSAEVNHFLKTADF